MPLINASDNDLRQTRSNSAPSISRNPVKAFVFKRRKPPPGAYPKNYSPYTLCNAVNSGAVSLSRPDIRNDLLSIQQAMVREFSSTYFEEVAVTSGCEPNQPIAMEMLAPKPNLQKISHPRLARRGIFSAIQAPASEAEERRQLRAAIKASQLDTERAVDNPDSTREAGLSTSELKMPRLIDHGKRLTCLTNQLPGGSSLLRQVYAGNISRTE